MHGRIRFLRWLIPVVILVEIGLVRTGVLSARTAIAVVVLIEVALAATMLGVAAAAIRRYRSGRAQGQDPWKAAEDALSLFVPRRAARLIVLEPRLWACLGRWVFRRHRPGETDFRYHGRSILGAFLILITLTTPVEIFLLELLLPWAWLRWLLLFAAVYGLLWLYGLYASLVVLPHRLEPDHLQVRYGHLNEATIPYDLIADVRAERRKAPRGGDGLQTSPEEHAVYLAVGGRTDLTLTLREPVTVDALWNPPPPVSTIHIAADRPDRMLAALNERLHAHSPRVAVDAAPAQGTAVDTLHSQDSRPRPVTSRARSV